MDAPTLENLDLACAKIAKSIAEPPSKDLENILTRSLAVLEEQGIYALFLFLEKQAKYGKEIECKLVTLLKETPQRAPLLSGDLAGDKNIFALLQEMAKDLDRLLLAHDLLRQTLVYARYHARLPENSEA